MGLHFVRFCYGSLQVNFTHVLQVYFTGNRAIASPINTLRPRQNGRHFADDTFNRIFVNVNVRMSIKFSLKFVPKDPINNIPSLVQIMAWRRPGDKPLSEPVMVSLLTHICVTRPQWVKIQTFWLSLSLKPHGHAALLALCAGNHLETYGLPSHRACNAELWCFLCCWPEQTVKQTVELPVIWEASPPMWHHCHVALQQ